MKTAILLTLLTWLIPAVCAAALPPDFDLKKYAALIELTAKTGEPMKDNFYNYRSISHIVPTDPSQPHKADYFTDVGVIDSSGEFVTMQVAVVSEDWRINQDGNWEIEQWNWTADTDGTLQSVAHGLLIEAPSGAVLEIKGLPVGEANDAAEIHRWSEHLKLWYSFEK